MEVEPKVFLIAEPKINESELDRYLDSIGASSWKTDASSDAEKLCEFYGRLCYKSFIPGLNPNVTKIREGNESYIKNVLNHGHLSVLEHAQLNFIFSDVSRVLCAELIRHRVGTAISESSLRYVRLEHLDYYVPVEIKNNEEAYTLYVQTMNQLEDAQKKLSEIFNINSESNFDVKKKLTSSFRRIAPLGLATTIGWSCNLRSLRHVIELRTSPHAEVEIRLLFSKVYDIVKDKYPNIFSDYVVETVDDIPWIHK